jgi:hypothetical protein
VTRRISRLAILSVVALAIPWQTVLGQNSFPLSDLMPVVRGGGLGNQSLAGDLLAAGVDPTVASGERTGIEIAGGSHVLDLHWASAGIRFNVLGQACALVFSSLSYGEQLRTNYDDRLGIFGGEFTPSDWNLALATILLKEGDLTVGAGATLSHAQLDEADALGLSGAVAVRRRFDNLEIRGGISNLGTVIRPFLKDDGTKLPARIRVGGAWLFTDRKVEISAEALYRFGEEAAGWGAGVEWTPIAQAALRIGLAGPDGGSQLSDSVMSDLGLTFGFAWHFSEWRLSYQYRPGGIWGDGHLIAAGWNLD